MLCISNKTLNCVEVFVLKTDCDYFEYKILFTEKLFGKIKRTLKIL